jgi:hypothetical protein
MVNSHFLCHAVLKPPPSRHIQKWHEVAALGRASKLS